jgi:hypothetical protein
LRTTRFGNGAEKVRKITVTKPDAMAARKTNMEENEPLDDLEQVVGTSKYFNSQGY